MYKKSPNCQGAREMDCIEARTQIKEYIGSGIVLEKGVEGVDVVGFDCSRLDILPCLSHRHCITILDSL